jgi:xanthine dehydrogenase accessory factor
MMPPESSIAYFEHAQDILATTVALIHSGQPCALVTSLAIEGGAAREVGSLAVVAQSGVMTGYLSNGCIDRDIMLHGLNAIQNGQIKHIRYGAGSPYMDLKLPCGGALELIINPAPKLEILSGALEALRAREMTVMSFAADPELILDGGGALRFQYAPKPALVLAGRGPILRSTATLAESMGFELHVASPDVDDIACLSDLNPKSTHRMTRPDVSLELPMDAHTAVLLLFHDHEWEHNFLMSAANAQPFFIGALGSRKTHEARLQRLLEAGLSAELCSKIQGPIGLVPSLRNASLIAVSSLAEVTSKLPSAQVRLP